jgi:Domain of unknown function (DUF222)/HNH endonuclease
MCTVGQPPARPATAAQATAMVKAGLSWLATTDATRLTIAEQAGCLRDLEQARSLHTAAHASTLRAFSTAGGPQADGQPTARSWLRGQTRVTQGAAGGAVAWMRRLDAHPRVAAELAAGSITESWAREICGWSDLLPEDARQDTDQILLGVAAAGAGLDDLAGLADEIHKRTAVPDTDDDDKGFGERQLRLATTFRGAGKMDGDLTPECAAAVNAVLESLGKKMGPEDTRTQRQRNHDALEEAMRRLIAAGCLPQRAGQPTQIQLHLSLGELRNLPGAPDREAAWAGPAAPPGADCDATLVPIVTGRVDPQILDHLASLLLRDHNFPAPVVGRAAPAAYTSQPADPATALGSTALGSTAAGTPIGRSGLTVADLDAWLSAPGWLAEAAARAIKNRPRQTQPAHTSTGPATEAEAVRWELARNAVKQLLVKAAADLMSGPAGLAAYLRTGLAGELTASVSLPLDVGSSVEIVPVHLRRALAKRDRGCRFPGCDQPAMACHPHHIIPRSEGGPTSLTNLLLLCSFHHLIAIHRWGWGIVLMPDGTLSATSPDKTQVLHSHGPPAQAA